MNVILKMEQFDIINIFFPDTKPNMLMDGIFTKINYSTQYFTMNGIYLLCESLDEFLKIEQQILEQYRIFSHVSKPAVFSQPSFFRDKHRPYRQILKISGIWENSSEYGITYKLFAG